ncbi:uncharacterized protein LOC144710276 [Wolffia australiana]
METPSSLGGSRRGKENRIAALADITNGSPIVGLAAESARTPPYSAAKSKTAAKNTPSSGEALLRGQVRSLLQKIDEQMPFLPLLHHLRSPPGFLAPTEFNFPQESTETIALNRELQFDWAADGEDLYEGMRELKVGNGKACQISVERR